MKSWEQEFKRHRSSCSPQLLRHPFTTMHTYTVTLDIFIASHQKQVVYIVLSNKMLSKIVQSFCLVIMLYNWCQDWLIDVLRRGVASAAGAVSRQHYTGCVGRRTTRRVLVDTAGQSST